MPAPRKPRAPRTPKANTYAEGGYPKSEHLEDVDLSHGFKRGDRVEFVEDFADDIPAGRRAVVENVDNHPTMPITVHIHNPTGGFFFSPVKPSEIRKVTDEQPTEGAVEAPEDGDKGNGDAAPEAVAA
jgi:hypothetical protein